MRDSHAPCSLLLCFFLGGILAGCKSVATTFHRVHNELTSELIKEDADEESHYYGAWFIWSPPLNPTRQGEAFQINYQRMSYRASPLKSLPRNVAIIIINNRNGESDEINRASLRRSLASPPSQVIDSSHLPDRFLPKQ